MKKNITLLIALIVPASISFSCLADLSSEITKCATITDNSKRLQCFDSTVTKYHSASTEEQKIIRSETVAARKKGLVKMAVQTSAATEVLSNTVIPPASIATEKVTSATSKTESFGRELENGLQQIESRINGKFSGWEKGMKLHLENGQIWKVVSNRSGYKPMTNPKIVINRGMLGSFDAKVEGLNARAKVKRLK